MDIVELLKQGLVLAMLISVPPVVTAVVVGIIIALLQSVMQLQDATLPFAVKMVAVGVVLAFVGHWMLQKTVQLSINCFDLISQIRAWQ
ncbi:type III secretion system export apparatus subunit SctS [Kosakonia pseudosacchari]|uniref:type III secretion system export apparatus subunit SctS n=1 Tax=Kosakonia pseudosacchari TaxID=1646340 RepID=UPI0018812BB8|nr:type III secretion system export apparatus subunit SctS [Kosakonia pseudosacchari]QOV64056.1 type III secretion system export apparatus subunit SctS [Kosakonia pseudosacchari]WBU49389.1 type III secretion system export apparatus subunit SctS [Kosakonia pseudosacchari]